MSNPVRNLSLRSGPAPFANQLSEEEAFLRGAAAESKPKAESAPLPAENEQPAQPKTIAFPTLGDPRMLSVPQEMVQVRLEHKDITISLFVLDVDVGADQIGLLLPATQRVENMRMKSKFVLWHDGAAYPVLYLGGNFEFACSIPKLRVLSFIRMQGKL